MPEPQTIPTLPNAAAMPLCDRPDCHEPATQLYRWDWGEKGQCCPKHEFELNQAAGNISRGITFNPISNVAPPMLRDERVRLKAEVFAAEEELSETKSRSLDLYKQTVTLSQQVQALTVGKAELEAQLKDAKVQTSQAADELFKSRTDQAQFTDELTRLRTLVPISGDKGMASELVRDNEMLKANGYRLQSSLADAERDNQFLKQEVSKLNSEAVASRDEMERMRLDLQRLGAELEQRTTPDPTTPDPGQETRASRTSRPRT